MSERLYDVVKSGSMVKRAQNKKRFTPVNYKHRWFELTKRTFSYFDVENVEVSHANAYSISANRFYLAKTNSAIIMNRHNLS